MTTPHQAHSAQETHFIHIMKKLQNLNSKSTKSTSIDRHQIQADLKEVDFLNWFLLKGLFRWKGKDTYESYLGCYMVDEFLVTHISYKVNCF